jgi:hypothetical protein
VRITARGVELTLGKGVTPGSCVTRLGDGCEERLFSLRLEACAAGVERQSKGVGASRQPNQLEEPLRLEAASFGSLRGNSASGSMLAAGGVAQAGDRRDRAFRATQRPEALGGGMRLHQQVFPGEIWQMRSAPERRCISASQFGLWQRAGVAA